MTSLKKISFLASSLFLLGACTTATSQFTPQCDFSHYQNMMQKTSDLALVPKVEKSMVSIPLNSILVNQASLGEKILPVAASGERLENKYLNISTRLQNCTDEMITLQARATFYDLAYRETEDPTAWQTIFVPANGRSTFTTNSLSQNADSFLVEIKAVD